MYDERPCRECNGLRLRRRPWSVRFQGLNIGEFSRMSVGQALRSEGAHVHGKRIGHCLTDIKGDQRQLLLPRESGDRLFTLDRPSLTLSGGESQRVRLATQMGSSLTGVLYVLDEPSIGLHPRDCGKLLESLSAVKDAGNTVIVIEHDEETIRWADHIVDMGPGAGSRGGWVVAEGSPAEIAKDSASLTGKYLGGQLNTDTVRGGRPPLHCDPRRQSIISRTFP
jgi:excinuclease ABC subunit A